jgi:tetratricopeptide (TPR) repeat protein
VRKVGVAYLAVVEQVCLSALDCQNFTLADVCLKELEKDLGIDPTNETTTVATMSTATVSSSSSVRYQLLRGRYFEAMGDPNRAKNVYESILEQNPVNNIALKRQYCIYKSSPNHEIESIQALNEYIQLHSYNDSTVWYELYVRYKEIGHWKYAIYCLQHVLFITTATRLADTMNLSRLHCELAECYVTSVSDNSDGRSCSSSNDSTSSGQKVETIRTARKHMATALELNPSCLRAKFGLIVISNTYLLFSAVTDTPKSKQSPIKGKDHSPTDVAETKEFEVNVSKELMNYGIEQVLLATVKDDTTTNNMQKSIQALMLEYRDGSE